MSLYARLIDRKLAQSVKVWDALPLFDQALPVLKAKHSNLPDLSWGELKDGEKPGCYIADTQDLAVFAICLALKGKDGIPSQTGKRRALYNEFVRGDVTVERWPHLVRGGASSGVCYLPLEFAEPDKFDGRTLCSSQQLLNELDELQPFMDYPKKYADLRKDGWEQFQTDVKRAGEMDSWSGEWTAWACLYWLARISVDRKLLVLFH